MENSVKAMYIAAGMLISVMILSVLMYVFSLGRSLGKSYEADEQTKQISAFNQQFERYSGKCSQSNSKADGYCFRNKSNRVSDVITCANLAYNINKKNDFDEKNNVQVVVKVSASKNLYVYPYKTQPKNYFLTVTQSVAQTASSFDTNNTTNCINFYNFMEEYNEVKIVNISCEPNYSSSAETIYKYYFDVDKDENNKTGEGIHYSEITGKVDKIVFTLYKTKEFDTLGDGTWSENL